MCSKLSLALLVLSISLFAQPPQFTLQDLGTLPNNPACTATGLSQSGDVTGYCVGQIGVNIILSSPQTHPFLYSKGAIAPLALTSDEPTALPVAVNDTDVVTGAFLKVTLLPPSVSSNPFLVQNGTVTLPQGAMQDVLPFALNNAGQLVGARIDLKSNSLNIFVDSNAILYDVTKGTTTVLPSPTDQGAAAFGISTNGTIAGGAVAEGGTTFSPLIWQSQKLHSLPQLSGFTQSLASSVNDSGVAAGTAFSLNFTALTDPLAKAHAVLFNTDGTVTDLGTLSSDQTSLATGINNSGWVVGFSSTAVPDFTLQLAAVAKSPGTGAGLRGFLYAGGKMYDLKTLVTNSAGWTLSYATAINNTGQIIGTGIFQGASGPEQHAFLLTPAAAPTGPSIGGIGGAAGSVPPVTTLSANDLFSIFGSNFSTTAAGINSTNIIDGKLPTNLANTCVEDGTTKLGLFFVSSGQINALLDQPASGTAAISVITNCGTANEVATAVSNVSVATVSPEFLYWVQTADGKNPIAALDFTTGILAGAQNLIPGATFAPVHSGDVIVAYGVGWGPTSSKDPIGTLASGAASLVNSSNYSLTVGGKPASVSYAGLSPGSAGLYQINFVVPDGLDTGNQAVVLTDHGVQTSANAFITVAQ